jgi:hypothetical protein
MESGPELALLVSGIRREDDDAFLAFLDHASNVIPGVDAGHSGRVRPLRRNEKHVVPGILPELAHSGQLMGEGFASAGVQLSRQAAERFLRQLARRFVRIPCVRRLGAGDYALVPKGNPWDSAIPGHWLRRLDCWLLRRTRFKGLRRACLLCCGCS